MSRKLKVHEPLTAHFDHHLLEDSSASFRADAHMVLVKGALPREKAQVRLEHVGPHGHAYARLEKVFESHASRVEAECSKFLLCGGCDLLHADYPFQLAFKRRIVADALSRSIDDVEPVVPSPSTFAYRSRAKFVVGEDGVLGSYRPRTHQVVNMDGCRVHVPTIEAIRTRISRFLREEGMIQGLRYVLVQAAPDRSACSVVLVVKNFSVRVASLVGFLERDETVAEVIGHENDEDGNALLGSGKNKVLFSRGEQSIELGGVRAPLRSDSFSQANAEASVALYQHVVGEIEPAELRIGDFYSGSGGISLFLLEAGASSVVSVERDKRGARALGCALALNSFHGTAESHSCSVETLPDDFLFPPRIVVNPPRRGLTEKALERLASAGWERLVYVSCNPQSLARDLEILQKTASLVRVRPFDMFPQTRHVEVVATLVRGPCGPASPSTPEPEIAL